MSIKKWKNTLKKTMKKTLDVETRQLLGDELTTYPGSGFTPRDGPVFGDRWRIYWGLLGLIGENLWHDIYIYIYTYIYIIYINYHIWHMDNIWHMDMVYLTVKGMITSWGLLLVHYRFGSYRIHPYPCGDLMYQNVWKCLVYFFVFNPTALVWDARPNL